MSKDMSAADSRTARKTRVFVAAAIVAGFVAVVGTALATPGVGIIAAPVHARGTVDHSQIVNSKSGVHLKTKGSVDFATQQIRIAEGDPRGGTAIPGRFSSR